MAFDFLSPYDSTATSIQPSPLVPADTGVMSATTDGIDYSALNAALNPTTGATYTSPDITAGDTSASSDVFSGLSDIFGSVGNAISQGIKASNQPSGPQIIRPGTAVYNPATGQYISTGAPITSAGIVGGMNSNMMLLILIAIIAYFVFR